MEQFRKLEPYWSLLQEAADTNNLANFKKFMIGRDVLGRNFFGRELSLKLTLPSSSAIKVRADSGTEKTLRGDVVRDVYLRPLTGREDSANLSISWSDAEKHTDKGVLTGFVGKRFVFAPKETIK